MEKEFKTLQYMAYAMMGLIALVIIVSVFRKFYLTLILLAAVLFLQIFVFRRKQKEYTAKAVRLNLQNTICKLLQTDKVIDHTGKEASDTAAKRIRDDNERFIKESGFFNVIDKEGSINTYITVDGTYGKGTRQLLVTTSDVTMTVPLEGAKISADVVPGNWTHIVIPGVTDLSEEDLPEQFHSRMASLKRFTTGKVFYRVYGNCADVFIKDRFLGAGFIPRRPVTDEMLRTDPLPELGKVLEMFYPLAEQQKR